MLRNVTTVVAALLIAVAPGARGQSSRPQFEVASIKASNDAPDIINMMRQPGGRFIATGVTAKLLITFAYSVQSTAVIGGPKWMDSDKWDIDARANEAESDTDTMPLRMQSLLESRFQLMAHKEIRESQIYELGVARRGSKLQVAAEGASKPGMPPNTMAVAQNRLQGHAVG